MITLRRAQERQYEQRRKQETWLTFYTQETAHPLANGFGSLETLKEGRFPPRGSLRVKGQEAEIITYVREGTLAYQDSTGQLGLIQAGEFQRMTAGGAIRYSETNASSTDWAHVFQIHLRPAMAGLEPGHEQKRFSGAERSGILCVVASPDGRKGSLRVHQDALLHSAILRPGQHLIHELVPGRSAWLHVIQGRATLGTIPLEGGDGAGISDERAVSLTAHTETEILLLELPQLAAPVVRAGNGAPARRILSDSEPAGFRGMREPSIRPVGSCQVASGC
jgi:redox-sensitive bicupin YhaK (pirin superfamily)